MEPEVKELLTAYQLEDCVRLLGYKTPEEVRGYMEKADIYLFTSDRQEGWGAVANEAMNSGCAVVANHLIGAAPYLIRHGQNGYIYKDGRKEELFALAERLVQDRGLCRQMGRCAYETITKVWNAENAAHNLMQLIMELVGGETNRTSVKQYEQSASKSTVPTPCAPAPIIKERHFN